MTPPRKLKRYAHELPARPPGAEGTASLMPGCLETSFWAILPKWVFSSLRLNDLAINPNSGSGHILGSNSDPALDFDPSTVLNFSRGSTFDSSVSPVFDSATLPGHTLYPNFSSTLDLDSVLYFCPGPTLYYDTGSALDFAPSMFAFDSAIGHSSHQNDAGDKHSILK
ncbi:hypothetical protein EVAR_8719_1 [Eumeta japonica]|uniref:Uncharacterized protein n=1 Tax=Eumeta variegata TaxID=151549 RepID=A0A4C1XL53_EUMVA|nr:hypothetical protein EVAR_8719_1 [Eumeta japonica]